jgi:hypothetical protein
VVEAAAEEQQPRLQELQLVLLQVQERALRREQQPNSQC